MNTNRHRSVDVLIWTILLCAIVVIISQCVQQAQGATGWSNTQWNSGVNLKQSAGNECYFKVPSSGHVNLLAHQWQAIRQGATITITYKIKASRKPHFVSLDPAHGLEPNFRPMLFTGDWQDANGRFWPAGAQCMWLIADGKVHTYTIRLNPKLWTNVWGKYDSAGFKTLLGHVREIDLAFGGGNSFSHGVRDANGAATFVLLGFRIN